MALRYEEVGGSVIDMYERLQKAYFSYLEDAKVRIVFDTKKSMMGNGVNLGKIHKPSELERFLTKEDAPVDGYDYIIVLDKIAWDNIQDIDRERILRHEMRHTYLKVTDESYAFILIPHDLMDFYAEVELNVDDPKWGQRVASMTSAIYDQMKEDAKVKLIKRK